MPFFPINLLLRHARENAYAVGAFNIFALEFLPSIIAAAEEEESPVILQINPVHFDLADLYPYVGYISALAAKSPVPVALNLDHGRDKNVILKAIRCGFPSVMIDGSRLPFEENVALTRQIVELCTPLHIAVEAELGTLNDKGPKLDHKIQQKMFTDPDAARDFVLRTGVRALAISIGNAHGVYRGGPCLDFNLLKKLRDRVPVPLVLHGGSGLSEADFQTSIQQGINKINIYTEMSMAALDQVRTQIMDGDETKDYPTLLASAREAVKQTVKRKMRTFGSSERARDAKKSGY